MHVKAYPLCLTGIVPCNIKKDKVTGCCVRGYTQYNMQFTTFQLNKCLYSYREISSDKDICVITPKQGLDKDFILTVSKQDLVLNSSRGHKRLQSSLHDSVTVAEEKNNFLTILYFLNVWFAPGVATEQMPLVHLHGSMNVFSESFSNLPVNIIRLACSNFPHVHNLRRVKGCHDHVESSWDLFNGSVLVKLARTIPGSSNWNS